MCIFPLLVTPVNQSTGPPVTTEATEVHFHAQPGRNGPVRKPFTALLTSIRSESKLMFALMMMMNNSSVYYIPA